MSKIPCEAVRDLLAFYLEDADMLEGKQRIAEHISQCESCRAYYQKLADDNKNRFSYEIKIGEDTGKTILNKMRRKQRNRLLIRFVLGIFLAGMVIYSFPMIMLREIRIEMNRDELVVGAREHVKVVTDPQWLNGLVRLKSSDEQILGLDEQGMLTALAAGEAELCAEIRNRKTTQSITVLSHPSLTTIYQNFGDHSWIHLSEDGKILELDTNPNDTGKKDRKEALVAFAAINDALLFPEDLYQKLNMLEDAEEIRSATIHDITIRWTYTPDTGLQIAYIQD